MTTKVPTPKPAHSPKLRDHRWQVDVSSPVPSKFAPGKTAQRVHTTGRFVTENGARAWAEATRKPGEKANLTYYSKIDNWLSHGIDTLTDEGWRGC